MSALVPTLTLSLLAALPALPQEEPSYSEVDYARVDRSLAKQPEYVAAPQYALFLFGPKADVRMWAVLDKSAAELEYYDVLYLDLDADGDLTDEGERFQGTWSEQGARAGMALAIRLKELPVPGTEIVHTDFLVSTVRKAGRKGIWFRMKWRGKEEVSGGYGLTGSDCTMWTGSPATAPVLRPTALGPLSFSLWGQEEYELPIGGSAHVNVIVGNRGSGPDTLCVLDEHFLDLAKDRLFVTILAEGWEGETVRARTRIEEHC